MNYDLPQRIIIAPGAHETDAGRMSIFARMWGVEVVRAKDDGSAPALSSVESSHWQRPSVPWPSIFAPLVRRNHGFETARWWEVLGKVLRLRPMVADGVWLKPHWPKAERTFRYWPAGDREHGFFGPDLSATDAQPMPPYSHIDGWWWSEHIEAEILGEVRVYFAHDGDALPLLYQEQYDGETDVTVDTGPILECLARGGAPMAGTLDMAVTDDGPYLIEYHEPYACGLYDCSNMDTARKHLAWMRAGHAWLAAGHRATWSGA